MNVIRIFNLNKTALLLPQFEVFNPYSILYCFTSIVNGIDKIIMV